nr:unnamed protein product [Spirometra erinaceieuropaei]
MKTSFKHLRVNPEDFAENWQAFRTVKKAGAACKMQDKKSGGVRSALLLFPRPFGRTSSTKGRNTKESYTKKSLAARFSNHFHEPTSLSHGAMEKLLSFKR